jgi:hypothetical protein
LYTPTNGSKRTGVSRQRTPPLSRQKHPTVSRTTNPAPRATWTTQFHPHGAAPPSHGILYDTAASAPTARPSQMINKPEDHPSPKATRSS